MKMYAIAARELITRLDDAFATVSRPGDNITVQNANGTICYCEECIEVRTYFADKRWQDVTDISDLNDHYTALAIFSGEAFRYFLPAYMRVVILFPAKTSLINEFLFFRFEDAQKEFGKSYFAAYFEPLSHDQKCIIRDYLRLDSLRNKADWDILEQWHVLQFWEVLTR
jgi:hypothetical protein